MKVAKATATLAVILNTVQAKKQQKPFGHNKIQLKKDEQLFDALDETLNNGIAANTVVAAAVPNE